MGFFFGILGFILLVGALSSAVFDRVSYLIATFMALFGLVFIAAAVKTAIMVGMYSHLSFENEMLAGFVASCLGVIGALFFWFASNILVSGKRLRCKTLSKN